MRDPAPVHYLRPNDTVWTPPALIVLDTETATISEPGRDIEALRLWSGHYADRRTRPTVRPRDEWADGDTADELADWVTGVTRNRETVWLFAHNLSFDLTTTRLPLKLVDRGWRVNDASVGGRSPWMRLGRGKRVLTLVDSYSWFPMALEEVATRIGMAKLRLPKQAEGRELWLARCRRDVEVTEAAVTQLLDWWDRQQLGRFNISGPSCGWNAFRHRPAVERIVIDPEPEVVKAEAKAYHGGRRGVWSIGDHAAGPFTELDFTSAYPSVAADLPLPIGRAYSFDSLPLDAKVINSDRWGIVAKVRVRTDTPRWPVKLRGAKWYPVGEFWTMLAGPDIREAARLGCLMEIGPGHVHRLGFAMAPWARWVLDVQEGHRPDSPEVARMVAKSWGREVIGKWAAKGYEKIKLGWAPSHGWGYEEGWDHTGKVHGGMVDLAGQRWWVAATGTADNAYPAIPAWVESEVRVRLNRVIEALGPGAVLQCDTDGLIVAERVVGTVAAHGHLRAPHSVPARGRLQWCLDQIDPVVAPLNLRVKRRLSHVTVLGPQHLVRDGARKYAGLPGMAEETAPGEFKAKLWPKLQWQMGNGDRRGYVRPEVRPVVKGPWPTGWVLADNSVVPLEVFVGKDGRNHPRDWNSSSYARDGLRSADLQHPKLAPLH